ncbi:uncharacterized protein MONOS_6359 [Monocercomonoides exilis]|uniref:uncharacterized protein n=1 Tax=Monocercomonoides exilis TaxID=2049356 RepID=UPI00355ABB02|nr:hypothetical protein MONOS_6359 [Monocercomonoides exilis]|eukprot:MONOS_6359.1-p1 / transcript=MONOS_6359.1 / gene=MONOS_6359 / organism=Monocercomonoides_exilis_PA203 / gene_product=unspecified product / transcript_product=unspecified product / location=Mono_scaffold00199:44441-48366(-) / protein_length=1268 / sequence_SO=supercontig / SO=protein_coding / is_pseudo=false
MLIILCCMQIVFSEDMDLVEAVESVPNIGSPPCPREGSFFHFINNTKRKGLFIGGGRDIDGNVIKDAYFYDLNRNLCNIAPTTNLDVLPDRYMCVSFCVGGAMYIWGGLSNRGLSDELLSYDFERISWKIVPPSGSIPCERYAPCTVETSSRVYIFGGQGSHGLLNDLWELDKQTFLWHCLRENDPTKNPPPLRDGGACVFKDYLFIFGGLTNNIDDKPNVYRIKLSNPDDCQLIEIITNYPFSGAIFRSGFTSYSSETECFGFIWCGKEGTNTVPLDVLFVLNLTAAGINPNVKNVTLNGFSFYRRFGKMGTSCTMDEEGTLYAFGGKDGDYAINDINFISKEDWSGSKSQKAIKSFLTNKSETFTFSLNNKRNNVFGLSGKTYDSSLPVTKHRLAELSGTIAVVGGYNPEQKKMMAINRLFEPDYGKWIEPMDFQYCSEEVPFVAEAAVAVLSGRIFVFGGATYDNDGDFATMSNDLFEYNDVSHSWQKIRVKNDFKPPKMCRSGATIYESVLYIAGGCDMNKILQKDIWAFNFATSEWLKVMEMDTAAQRPTIFVKSIILREHLTNHKKSKSQHTKYEMEKLKALNEKVKGDDQKPIPHLFVCGGDEKERPIEGCFAHPLEVSASYGGWLNLKGPKFPIGSSVVVVGDGEIVFVVGGEESGVAKKSFLSIFTFDEYGEIKLATHKYDEDREEMDFPIVHGSCIFMLDSLYCLGGYAVSDRMTPLPIATNKLTRIKLKSHLSGCAPGSYFNNETNKCVLCANAAYSSHLNQTECEKCPIGSDSWGSGTSIYSCVPCKEGTFMSEIHHYNCTYCESNSSCIVGSAANNNTLQRKPFECTEQPKSYDPNSNKETMFTVLFYGVSLILGLIVAVVCFCLPTRDKLYKLDQYSNTYKDVLDEKTHKAIKTVKKTSYGGCVSIIGICFVVGAASAVIVLFFLINTLENRIYVDSKIQNITLDKFTNKKMEFIIRLRDYSGECVKDVKDKHAEAQGECSPLLGIGKTSYDPLNIYPTEPVVIEPRCSQSPSPNKLFASTTDCSIRLSGENISIDTIERRAKLLSFYSKEKDAFFYGIDGFISVDSGITQQKGYFFIDSSYQSQAESHFDGDPSHIFKGGEQTQVVAELMVSKYEENKWKHIVQMGHEASRISIKPGSQVKNSGLSLALSVGVDVLVELSQTVVVTTRSFKTSAVGLITALGGTFVYLNYIGKLIPVVEFIFSGKLFCGCCKKKWKASSFKCRMSRDPLLDDERKKIQMESDDVTQDIVGYSL